MPDLDRARPDLGYFATVVGHPLAPWQLPAWRSMPTSP
jgi:hypothetical protein